MIDVWVMLVVVGSLGSSGVTTIGTFATEKVCEAARLEVQHKLSIKPKNTACIDIKVGGSVVPVPPPPVEEHR